MSWAHERILTFIKYSNSHIIQWKHADGSFAIQLNDAKKIAFSWREDTRKHTAS